MNVENMRKVIDYLSKIDDNQFDMNQWEKKNECGTVRCVVGYLPVIFPEKAPDFINHSLIAVSKYRYNSMSEEILGDFDFDTWAYMFSHVWARLDNTVAGAIERMEEVIAGKRCKSRDDYTDSEKKYIRFNFHLLPEGNKLSEWHLNYFARGEYEIMKKYFEKYEIDHYKEEELTLI